MDTVQNGKGSKARPISVSREAFEENWDAIFARKTGDAPVAPMCGHRGGYISIHPAKDGSSQCTDCANRMRGFY